MILAIAGVILLILTGFFGMFLGVFNLLMAPQINKISPGTAANPFINWFYKANNNNWPRDNEAAYFALVVGLILISLLCLFVAAWIFVLTTKVGLILISTLIFFAILIFPYSRELWIYSGAIIVATGTLIIGLLSNYDHKLYRLRLGQLRSKGVVA